MSEFITVQVGQCGNQIGSCFWKSAIREYGILDTSKIKSSNKYPPLCQSFNSFFWCPNGIPNNQEVTVQDLENAAIKARAVCIDMEDSVVARFRKGPLRGLFSETCLITNYPGSGNNWAEGFLNQGNQYIEQITERIRKSAECCDSLHGFLLLYSLGGGTGSGLGSRVLALLEEQYPHVDRLVTCVYPAGSGDVVTAPYNVALATNELIKSASCVVPVNNQALTNFLARVHLPDQRDKLFRDINNIVVKMLLHLTSGARFSGSLNVDMNEISTNLVPFPGMHFVCSSLSPLCCIVSKIPPGTGIQIDEILSGTWCKHNQLLEVDPLRGVILAGALTVRGKASLNDLRYNISRLSKKAKYISWNQDGLKIGLCSIPPPGHETSAMGLFNSSALSNIFQEAADHFNKLFRRRAHVHHYLNVNGFEMENFTDSLESLQDIANAYTGLETHKPDNVPRLKTL